MQTQTTQSMTANAQSQIVLSNEVLKRLMDEVRVERNDINMMSSYNRVHNRHNR